MAPLFAARRYGALCAYNRHALSRELEIEQLRYAIAALVANFAIGWLLSPKNRDELMEQLKIDCERKGGVFYEERVTSYKNQDPSKSNL